MSNGVKRRRSGKSSSVATMSSPMRRTCRQGGTETSTRALPSSVRTTSSIMTTASYPLGKASPVLTWTKSLPGASRAGAPSLAAKVSEARVAMPSMAAQWAVGEEAAA